jgi:hypothetical protein
MKNVVPLPTSLVAQILPLWMSKFDLAMESPSPLPWGWSVAGAGGFYPVEALANMGLLLGG